MQLYNFNVAIVDCSYMFRLLQSKELLHCSCALTGHIVLLCVLETALIGRFEIGKYER
jgi:hypothetical protein